MLKTSRRFLGVLGAGVFFCSLASGETLFSIGPDEFGAGRVFSAVPGLLPSFPLGDGSVAFNGGLAAVSDTLFYAVANDSFGNSSLHSFTLGGSATLSPIASLGLGFNGGLAFNTADENLYAVSNDPSGVSSLNRVDLSGNVTSLGLIGSGFYGGLTFNPFTGLLYGFQGDFTGAQRVFNSISPTAAPVVNPLFALGDGSISFNGGVAFDPADSLYYAISNDFLGNSTLNRFSLAGETSLATVAPAFAFGYVNVGLTASSAPIPEPASGLYVATAALLALGLKVCFQRRNLKSMPRS